MDIHGYGKKVEDYTKALDTLKPEDKADILAFKRQLSIDGLSIGRVAKYLWMLRALSRMMDKPFRSATKDDIVDLVEKLKANPKYKPWTVRDFKQVLKRFYRWLKNIEKPNYPEEVKWISLNMKHGERLPESILSQEEVEQIAGHTRCLRDKAFVLTLYATGARVGEILPLKIKDITFDNIGAVFRVDGKTGARRIRSIIYVSDLIKWLDSHPAKSDPDSYVWLGRSGKPLGYGIVVKILRKAAADARITKAVNPHSFRHGRATRLANDLTESQLNEFFGWSKGSDTSSTYVHLSGRDLDGAILKSEGIDKAHAENAKPLGTRPCPNCQATNSVLEHFCNRCKAALDLNYATEYDTERRTWDEFVRDFITELASKDRQAGVIFRKMVKERHMESLFNGGGV